MLSSRPGSLRTANKSLGLRSVSTVRDAKKVPVNVSSPPTETGINESTLSNGIRILSVDRASPVSSLSLFVKAGSRYESRSTSGATHFLKFFANQNNSKKSGLRLVRDLEHYGTTLNVDFDREYVGYNIVLSRFEDIEVKIAAESLRFLLSPLLQEYEVDRLREVVALDSPCETQKLLELAHAAAFRDQGLGQPLYANRHAIDNLDGRHLHRHLTDNFISKNMTIVGTGMEHSQLKEVVSSLFSDVSLQGDFFEFQRLGALPVDTPSSQTINWTGGEVRHPGPGHTKLLLAYQGGARNTKEEVAFTIAKSALNLRGLDGVCTSESFYLPYSDTGLFALQACSAEGQAGQTLATATSAIKKLADISTSDFEVAKAAALTHHLHKVSCVRSLAKQISLYGRLNDSSEINSLSINDFKSALSRLNNPVIVASGDVRGINRV